MNGTILRDLVSGTTATAAVCGTVLRFLTLGIPVLVVGAVATAVLLLVEPADE